MRAFLKLSLLWTFILTSFFFLAGNAHASVDYVRQWGSPGSGNGEFNDPLGIAYGNDGYIYVADLNNDRVQKFTALGQYVSQISATGAAAIAFDSSNNMYVTDDTNDQVYKFSSSGSLLKVFGNSVDTSGPLGVFASSSNLYVASGNRNRISQYDLDGNFIVSWGTVGSHLHAPSGIAQDGLGNFYITNFGSTTVSKYSNTHVFVSDLTGLSAPFGLAIDTHENLYVSNGAGNNVTKFGLLDSSSYTFGDTGSDDGQFIEPAGVAVDNNGYIYVADSGNSRIEVFADSDVIPTPTLTPNSGGGGSSQLTNNVPTTPTCSTAPNGSPNLFQINTSKNSATLYFSPVGQASNYLVSYGFDPNANQFNVFTNQGASTGVLSYTIGSLPSNSNIYLKVFAQNNCGQGNWSNIMQTKTNGGIYYKNIISQAFNASLVNAVLGAKTVAKPNLPIKKIINSPISKPTIKKTPTIKQKPKILGTTTKKSCFLFICH